jgi:antitoxin component YwqK of YwqJK toxin-antitoxin module
MSIKFLLAAILFFSSYITSFSQQYKYIYYLDENLNAVEKSKSILIGKAYYENGALKMDCFGKTIEKLFLTATFTDSTLDELQGLFRSYHTNMSIESEGNYTKNLKQGLWQEWDKKGQKTDSLIYENGYRVRFAKFEYYEKVNAIRSYAFTDSFANTYTQLYFYEKGNLSSEVTFVGQRGLLKSYDSTDNNVKTDSVFSREEIEASYPGGDQAWMAYLRKNLNPNVPSEKGAPNGMYDVVIKFKVTKDGTLADIEAETNKGYGTEGEAIRLIKKSAKWNAAKQYGRFVTAYRRQPITFSVDNMR